MINLHDMDEPYERRRISWRNRYGDQGRFQIKIYVEADVDREFYRQLIGASLGRWIDFAAPADVPQHVGDGHFGARQAVRHFEELGEEWLAPGLRAHCCLLDGEEAMTSGFDGYDAEDELVIRTWLSELRIAQVVAPVPRNDRTSLDPDKPDAHRTRTPPRNDGVLLLNCHEMENLYFLYAGAAEMMLDAWGDKRRIYGMDLPSSEAWRCLHRAILIAVFNGVKNKYNPKCEQYSIYAGQLANTGVPLGDLPHKIASMLEAGFRRDLKDEAMTSMTDKLDWLAENEDEVRSFSNYSLRICDGKALLAHGFAQHRLFERHFKASLLRNGFAGDFQISLVFSLMRQAHFLSGTEEMVFGRGARALIGNLRSRSYP